MPPENSLPNHITIVGRGVPSNYEISVSGTIEMMNGEPLEGAPVVSGRTVEGTIETGVHRFCFSGQMLNTHIVDWNGIPAPESPCTPYVHIQYSVPVEEEHV